MNNKTKGGKPKILFEPKLKRREGGMIESVDDPTDRTNDRTNDRSNDHANDRANDASKNVKMDFFVGVKKKEKRVNEPIDPNEFNSIDVSNQVNVSDQVDQLGEYSKNDFDIYKDTFLIKIPPHVLNREFNDCDCGKGVLVEIVEEEIQALEIKEEVKCLGKVKKVFIIKK